MTEMLAWELSHLFVQRGWLRERVRSEQLETRTDFALGEADDQVLDALEVQAIHKGLPPMRGDFSIGD